MAITEQEIERITAAFDKATDEGNLVDLEVEEIDVLYPYSDGPAVLRVKGDKGVELWAVLFDEKLAIEGALQVGTQDEFGRCHWSV